jgi:hypothetical protein
MHSAIHQYTAAQRHADLGRCRQHPLADVPPTERRLSTFGARLFGLVRPKPAPAPLRPAAGNR